MGKLSVIIPSRDERFLVPTIDDIFSHATGEIEVVAVLDSDKWPENWAEVVARHAPRLHTIHQGSPKGMRAAINAGVASAISRGATYIAKSDGHCSFSEGFDEVLKAEMDDDWIVVPRRLRLDAENWTIAEPDKPPYDYHYLSFPDDPNDFGGAGLNGKPWFERQKERVDIPLDEEMSSQGSFWAMKADYFTRLELMDEASYGPFWNEFQELGLKCWLSGGRGMVNKKCWYAHLHKGSKHGRGYRLSESWLKQGRNHTMLWPWNEAWAKQTLPFEWLIDHFWPVPTWSENWKDILYRERKPRTIAPIGTVRVLPPEPASVADKQDGQGVKADEYTSGGELRIHSARYGVFGSMPPFSDHSIDVADRVRSLVKNDSLDIIVNNSTLCPGQNPFRGKKKVLLLTYSYGDADPVTVERVEKDWLIIGHGRELTKQLWAEAEADGIPVRHNKRAQAVLEPVQVEPTSVSDLSPDWKQWPVEVKEKFLKRLRALDKPKPLTDPPLTATALNDYLIRKFQISPQRLKAPMPIELNNFHRDDLAQLFAELGFKRGAEIGVAEGNYSEILLKANPECELLLVDPWHAYSDNPQNKTKEKHEFAHNETVRKTKDYPNVKLDMRLSMDAVRDVPLDSLQFVYIDGAHSYDYVMSDLIEWSRRVQSAGVVALDDWFFIDRKRWGAGVVEAVQSYTMAHDINPWFICQGHKSVEAWWVKP